MLPPDLLAGRRNFSATRLGSRPRWFCECLLPGPLSFFIPDSGLRYSLTASYAVGTESVCDTLAVAGTYFRIGGINQTVVQHVASWHPYKLRTASFR